MDRLVPGAIPPRAQRLVLFQQRHPRPCDRGRPNLEVDGGPNGALIGKRDDPEQTAGMADTEPPPYYEPPTPFAQQRSDLRAGLGRRMGEPLDAIPRLWKLCPPPRQPIQLYIGDGFLTAD